MHCYDSYYKSQGYKLHYPVAKGIKNENTDQHVTKTMGTVMGNLSHLEAAPSVGFVDATGGVSMDAEALFCGSPPREDDDPMEILHRRCGEMDQRSFLMELGKRHLGLTKDKEDGDQPQAHRHRSGPVKRHRSEKLYCKY